MSHNHAMKGYRNRRLDVLHATLNRDAACPARLLRPLFRNKVRTFPSLVHMQPADGRVRWICPGVVGLLLVGRGQLEKRIDGVAKADELTGESNW
jgi:hypothetical protein